MTLNQGDTMNPAWMAALDRFQGGYGEPFDPSHAADVMPFLQILEEEVRSRIEAEIAGEIRTATARVRAIGTDTPPRAA